MSSPASLSSAVQNADLPADGTGCDKLNNVVIEIAQFMKDARCVLATSGIALIGSSWPCMIAGVGAFECCHREFQSSAIDLAR